MKLPKYFLDLIPAVILIIGTTSQNVIIQFQPRSPIHWVWRLKGGRGFGGCQICQKFNSLCTRPSCNWNFTFLKNVIFDQNWKFLDQKSEICRPPSALLHEYRMHFYEGDMLINWGHNLSVYLSTMRSLIGPNVVTWDDFCPKIIILRLLFRIWSFLSHQCHSGAP